MLSGWITSSMSASGGHHRCTPWSAPCSVDIEQPAVHGNSLDKIIRVVEQIAVLLLAVAEPFIGRLDPGDHGVEGLRKVARPAVRQHFRPLAEVP